jgi:hypothetical protein
MSVLEQENRNAIDNVMKMCAAAYPAPLEARMLLVLYQNPVTAEDVEGVAFLFGRKKEDTDVPVTTHTHTECWHVRFNHEQDLVFRSIHVRNTVEVKADAEK